MKQLAILTVTLSLTVTGSALAQQNERKVLPTATNWVWATNVAEKVFPGTKQWLLNCSSGEGGWSYWKWNYQGSGAGGWMQFMQGTFNSYVGPAYQEVLKRGYRVKQPLSYTSPLGQALTAAYMRTTGVYRTHWAGSYRCV